MTEQELAIKFEAILDAFAYMCNHQSETAEDINDYKHSRLQQLIEAANQYKGVHLERTYPLAQSTALYL